MRIAASASGVYFWCGGQEAYKSIQKYSQAVVCWALRLLNTHVLTLLLTLSLRLRSSSLLVGCEEKGRERVADKIWWNPRPTDIEAMAGRHISEPKTINYRELHFIGLLTPLKLPSHSWVTSPAVTHFTQSPQPRPHPPSPPFRPTVLIIARMRQSLGHPGRRI